MAKKISPEENFLTSGIFTFESCPCACEKSCIFNNLSENPQPAIKCTPNTQRHIYFAFGTKVGLVRINDDGSIAEENLLGKLSSIKQDSFEEYVSFFERNGFLFPINKSETFGLIDLQLLIDRLRATLELLSTITDMSRTSYEKIVRLVFYHLFAPVIEVETKDGKFKYHSVRHQYSIFLESKKDSKREKRLEDTFNNSEFVFKDSLGTVSLNSDFIDSVLLGRPEEDRYAYPVFRNVFTAYCSVREENDKNMLLINDFMFHYFYEVGIICHVDLYKVSYVDGIFRENHFNDKLKVAAVKIAKYIIREEIESNLRRVRPTYNISKMEPAWKIDSLLSALYFGLFYMKPNMKIYRQCANQKCGNFFLVPVSSRKKKYCCTACMNRDMAARKRARDKIKSTRGQ